MKAKDDPAMIADGLFCPAWIRDGSGRLCVGAETRFLVAPTQLTGTENSLIPGAFVLKFEVRIKKHF
jgi:hypothetical protein